MPKAKPARRPESKRSGDIAEIAFLQKATNHGLRVSKPYGESDRYDFIIDNGTHRLRIQVKSTGKAVAKNAYQLYAKHSEGLRKVAYLKSEVDFIACYISPEDAWYIIPLKALAGHTNVRLYASNHPRNGRYGEYCEAWHLLKQERRDSK